MNSIFSHKMAQKRLLRFLKPRTHTTTFLPVTTRHSIIDVCPMMVTATKEQMKSSVKEKAPTIAIVGTRTGDPFASHTMKRIVKGLTSIMAQYSAPRQAIFRISLNNKKAPHDISRRGRARIGDLSASHTMKRIVKGLTSIIAQYSAPRQAIFRIPHVICEASIKTLQCMMIYTYHPKF